MPRGRRSTTGVSAGLLADDTFYVLLAAVIEGADRVANTAGRLRCVHQAVATERTTAARGRCPSLRSVPLVRCIAHQADAAQVAETLGPIDLLYVDPPYNTRQYAGYYHVPELIARGWFEDDGKAARENRPHRRRGTAQRLVLTTGRAECASQPARGDGGAPRSRQLQQRRRHRGQGIASAILTDAAIDGRVKRFTRRYKRYRADSDREGRRYKGDEVRELLYYARLR